MRDIKPSVLSRILDFSMESDAGEQDVSSFSQAYKGFSYLNVDLPSLIFEFSNFKPVKDNILNRSDIMSNEERTRFELIINKILEFKYLARNSVITMIPRRSLRPADARKECRKHTRRNPEINTEKLCRNNCT